jgi:replicative DNA helicase
VPGSSQIIIAKHRNGQTGEVNLRFVDKYAKFVNLETDFSAFGTPSPIPYGGFGGSDQQANVRVMPSKMNNFGNEEAPC